MDAFLLTLKVRFAVVHEAEDLIGQGANTEFAGRPGAIPLQQGPVYDTDRRLGLRGSGREKKSPRWKSAT